MKDFDTYATAAMQGLLASGALPDPTSQPQRRRLAVTAHRIAVEMERAAAIANERKGGAERPDLED